MNLKRSTWKYSNKTVESQKENFGSSKREATDYRQIILKLRLSHKLISHKNFKGQKSKSCYIQSTKEKLPARHGNSCL
jgi:hypothetical protein